MDQLELLIAALLAATALLLIVAEFSRRTKIFLPAAWLAIFSGAAASLLLFTLPDTGASWQPFDYARSGARKGGLMLAWPGGGGGGGRHGAGGGGGGSMPEAAGDDGSSSAALVSDWLAALNSRSSEPDKPIFPAGGLLKDCDDCPELVIVPPGTALIGAGPDDPAATAAERPARRVGVWPGFAIGRLEISTAQFQSFLTSTGHTAPHCAGSRSGAAASGAQTCLSWSDAAAYVSWLTGKTGKRYRLPSAAEWEYAARWTNDAPRPVARTSSFVASATAAELQPDRTLPVGMPGGVGEFTADCWHDRLDLGAEGVEPYLPARGCLRRIVKDGDGSDVRRWQRLSARRPVAENEPSPAIGFRVLRQLR